MTGSWLPAVPDWEARWVKKRGGALVLRNTGAKQAFFIPFEIVVALCVRELRLAKDGRSTATPQSTPPGSPAPCAGIPDPASVDSQPVARRIETEDVVRPPVAASESDAPA